jgi:predicted nucleotidyltransferase
MSRNTISRITREENEHPKASKQIEGTIYDYMRFKEYVASLFQGPVDVIDRAGLKPHLRAPSGRDGVYAF